MKDERPWGYYEVLADHPDFKVKHIVVRPGKRISLQYHLHRKEHWTIVRGCGVVTRDGEKISVLPGSSLDIPVKAAHRIENTGDFDLDFIEVQMGESFAEEDIVRIEDDFGRS